MFSTLSGCAFDIFNGFYAGSVPSAIHRLWRNDMLFSIRIACSCILCPCLIGSLDMFMSACSHLLPLLCGFVFLAHVMYLHVYFHM